MSDLVRDYFEVRRFRAEYENVADAESLGLHHGAGLPGLSAKIGLQIVEIALEALLELGLERQLPHAALARQRQGVRRRDPPIDTAACLHRSVTHLRQRRDSAMD